MPMRHGLTLGEMGRWFVDHYGLDVDLSVITMEDWIPAEAPGFGWPVADRSWVNPSPNASILVDGARLCGDGHARRHHPLGRPRHNASAGTLWGTGH